MKRKMRLMMLGAAIVLPLGLSLWGRSIASWRPQKVGLVSFGKGLIKDERHGPWMYNSEHRAINLENGTQAVLPDAIGLIPPHFSPDGRSFVAAIARENDDSGNNLRVEWRECASGELLRRFNKFVTDFQFQLVQFSADGADLLIPKEEGIEILPLDGSKERFYRWPVKRARNFLSPDGKWTCSYFYPDGSKPMWKIYNLETGALSQVIKHGRGTVRDFSLSPDSSLLYVFDVDFPNKSTGAWIGDAKTGAKLWNIGEFEPILRFSQDSKAVLIFNRGSSKLKLHDARTGKLLCTSTLPKPPRDAEFSFDGSSVYAEDQGDTVWKVRVR